MDKTREDRWALLSLNGPLTKRAVSRELSLTGLAWRLGFSPTSLYSSVHALSEFSLFLLDSKTQATWEAFPGSPASSPDQKSPSFPCLPARCPHTEHTDVCCPQGGRHGLQAVTFLSPAAAQAGGIVSPAAVTTRSTEKSRTLPRVSAA